MRRLLIALGVALSMLVVPTAHAATSKRVVVYYQTQYSNGSTGTYVSPLPLLQRGTGVTDVLVAAIHLNADRVVHLNDHPPAHSRYTQMWKDLAAMQARGINVIGMVGGAAQGSFQRLDTQFDTFYPLLKNVITTYKLNGVDLDVEERMSLTGVKRLIDRLRADFGSGFLITLSPVASALSGGGNLSGFSYDQLYRDRGTSIAWFNGQFYNGWGNASTTADYDRIISRGVIPANKVVLGTLTNRSNGGGYVDITTLKSNVTALKNKYANFGGVAGWEYFNSLPGGTARPWEWASNISAAMR